MQIDRDIYQFMRHFFQTEKKALLISGARQVGKTYAIRHVGRELFDQVVELNFIEQPQLKSVFEHPRSSSEMLLRLSAFAGDELKKGRTLFFFDEVQECPDMVTALKFLVDEGSYRYVLSGSLLGVQLKDIRSLPVGYLTEKRMYPLNIHEFASAMGMSAQVMNHLSECYRQRTPVDSVVHEKMLELLRRYMVIGGMPDVVVRFLETNDLQAVRDAQHAIIQMYYKDIAKYDSENKLYIKDVFDLIPSELNAKNKRFILKSLNEHAKFDRFRNSFLWLSDAGVALPTYNVEEPRVPLKLNQQRNLFKLFLNDVGLLSSFYSPQSALNLILNEGSMNYGAVYENLVAQELAANGFELYYFNSKRQGEVDFIIEHGGKVCPIEVKSGKDYKRHNALTNLLSDSAYSIEKAFVFSNANLEEKEQQLYMPIYMLMYLQAETKVNLKFYFHPL